MGIAGILIFCASLAGLFCAYYYSWRISVPGVSQEIIERDDLIARVLGETSLVFLGLSLAMMVLSVWQKRRRK